MARRIALCALSIRVVITYLWKDPSHFGASIIWWNGAFGFCTGAAVAWGYYLSRRWERFAPAAAKK